MLQIFVRLTPTLSFVNILNEFGTDNGQYKYHDILMISRYGDTPDYVGMSLEDAFSDQTKSLEDCKEDVRKLLEEHGVEVSLNKIKIHYGECEG